MKREKIAVQYADAKNPPTVKVNFAGTGFVSVIGKDGVAVQKSPVVNNMVTKEILWQLNKGKQQDGRYNGWDIQQMFTHCALGDGNWDGSLVANGDLSTYVPQEGVDIARKTTLDMFHLDNAKTKFQDQYYTATGFSGCDDMWDDVNRLYTFKFRRSYRFNMTNPGAQQFICREIGLFAQVGGYVRAGDYRGAPSWVTNPAMQTGEYAVTDPDRPNADNPLGYPWDMTARLVLPTPLIVDLSQSIVVTYDFTMTVDCNSQDVVIRTRNTRTGEISDGFNAKLGYDFKCARTAFGGYRTLPASNADGAPGAMWNSITDAGAIRDNDGASYQNKGFLSNNTRNASASYMFGRYRQDYQFDPATGVVSFAESPMNTNNPGTQIPTTGLPAGQVTDAFYSHVKTNHARFQAKYTYQIRVPYRNPTDPTWYPNEFNICGIRLWFEPIQYSDGVYRSPVEWRPSRQFFLSVSVAMSFNNQDASGNALPSDRNIITSDWGYADVDVPNHVYDSYGEWGDTPALVASPAIGTKGYFLREWNDGADSQQMYFPVWYKTVNGNDIWWAEDDMPVIGGTLPDGTAVPDNKAGVVYHLWDANIAAKEASVVARKPFRRGFMLDDRDGNVYMCLCAHFANGAIPANEYRWVHTEPFRLRHIGMDSSGTPYPTPYPIGACYGSDGAGTNPFPKYGNPMADPHGGNMWREQLEGRMYSQYEAMNATATTGWPAFVQTPADWSAYIQPSGWRGIAPKGWHIPSDGEQSAFLHGQINGTSDSGEGTGSQDSRNAYLLPWNGQDPFGFSWYYFGYRYSGGWGYRGSYWYLWSSCAGRSRGQSNINANVDRYSGASQSRFSVVCFKD